MTGRGAETEPHYQRAAALRAKLVQDDPRDRGTRALLAEDYLNLGELVRGSGRSAAAVRAYQRAEVLLRPLAGGDSAGGECALSLAGVQMNWGNLLRDRGNPADALVRMTEAVWLAETVLRQEPRHSGKRPGSAWYTSGGWRDRGTRDAGAVGFGTK